MTDETKLTPMQKVDELIERGKSKGGLTYKEVIDTLGNDALDVDQMIDLKMRISTLLKKSTPLKSPARMLRKLIPSLP